MKKYVIIPGLIIIAGLFVVLIVTLATRKLRPEAKLGDNVRVSTKADDCSGELILARTKEAEDEMIRLASLGDSLGVAKMTISGEAFYIPNCTKAKVINFGSMNTLKEVRILEGKELGESGWVPSEWARL